ncbi:major facilitator superfamily domain-containing protein [Xylariales sp. PMI_506]|nr:major facilitator superfamily domain-containing protein [Xylariales sp. PMI_506]
MSEKTSESPMKSAGSGNDSIASGDIVSEQSKPAVAQSSDFSDAPPDGGTTAWLAVLGSWCTAFCSFGWINSIGTFQEYYQNGPLIEYSASTISWIPSLQVFFMMAMGPIVGKLFDKYGPVHLIVGGTLLHVFGLMMASISKEYYQFLLSQGVCSAIGAAAIFQPCIMCISTWFRAKRGMAMGIVASGSSVGGVVFPIMVPRLIASVGYGWAMRTSAFVILALLLVAIATVRPRKAVGGASWAHKAGKPDLAAPFKEIGFVCTAIGAALLTFAIFIPIDYLPVQAMEEVGMSPDLAQYLLAILNAGSLFGRLLSGWASDKIGRFNGFIISCYLSCIFILGLWIPGRSQSAIIAFAALFGFSSGAYVGLLGALVAAISPLQEIGFRTGLIFLGNSVGGLTTSPIAGAILEHSGWTDLKIFSGVLCFVGTTVVLAARLHLTDYKLIAAF